MTVARAATALLFSCIFAVAGPARGADANAAADPAAAPLLALVQHFIDAQRTYNVAALSALTADTYIEISPLGDVDPRQKMLGFYVTDGTKSAPPLQLDEPIVRVLGDSAVIIAKLVFSVSIDGQRTERALRASYVAVRSGDNWKLVSAQFTPVHANRAAKTPS